MQGRRNNKWTAEEENALFAGIAKHGVGKWSKIVDDPVRNNIQLKEKWRNIQKRGRLVEEKSKTQGIKSASISNSTAKTSPLVSNEPSPNPSSDMSNESRYHAMVFEAISTINAENGSDLSGILSFIEERYEVPQNFTKLLSKSLRTLVSQGNLDKYLMENEKVTIANAGAKSLQDLNRGKQCVGNITNVVAKRIVVAEKKEFIASEAVKKAERMQQLAEESELTLQLVLDIHEQCALGKKVLLR